MCSILKHLSQLGTFVQSLSWSMLANMITTAACRGNKEPNQTVKTGY